MISPTKYLSVLLLFYLSTSGALATVAEIDIPRPSFAFTAIEQSAILSNISGQNVARTMNFELTKDLTYYQRDFREKWAASDNTYERQLISERIGNQGRARYAAERGWQQILGSRSRGIRQGPDSAYWDPKSGVLRVLETKGNTSPTVMSYGWKQGTNVNTIFSAERTISSSKTTLVEKEAAARVIVAAKNGRLQTGVIRTTHVDGKPNVPRLDEGKWESSNHTRDAFGIEQRLVRKNPELSKIFRKAKFNYHMDRMKYLVYKGVPYVGIASSALLILDAYNESEVTMKMFQDPSLRNTVLPYLHGGLALGKSAESGTLGFSSMAYLGLLKGGQVMKYGKLAGKAFLPIAVGVEALNFGVSYYEYSSGRINQLNYYKRTTGPVIFTAFTATGAVVGAFAGGGWNLGAGAVPGAWAGASIGATVSIPFTFVGDWAWNLYFKYSDARQMEVVFSAIDSQYGR
jgi:hypothetical protein